MDHHDHVSLLRPGIKEKGGVWADLGSGRGAFTFALAELLGASGTIYSVDKDRRALQAQSGKLRDEFPQIETHFLAEDFTGTLNLPKLDGIVMANSLHFIRLKKDVLKRMISYLKPDGRFILVEYNADRGNLWVPYPLSFTTWQKLARQSGLLQTEKIGARPSRFLGEIFSAMSIKE